MMLIPCPWCGPREETEFQYGGAAHVAYPADPAALSDEEWARYLFYRDNPKGEFAERWSHSVGCRRWFNVVRDTVSNEIRAVYRVGEPRPAATGDPNPAATGDPNPAATGGPRPAPAGDRDRPAHE